MIGLIRDWLKDCWTNHKLRLVIGLVVLVTELFLFLGTGIMKQDVINYHTGAGSWPVQITEETASLCQEFTPMYSNLKLVSFMMHKEYITEQDGVVSVIIADASNQIVFEKELAVSEVKDGRFTDVEVNLKVTPNRKYYMTVVCGPSSLGEYPQLGVCNLDIVVPENGVLIHAEEMQGTQMVSRYHYENVIPASKLRNIVIICLVTAFGIMFGLPDNRYLRIITGVILLAAVPYLLGQRLELLTYEEVLYMPKALTWNVGIMYGLELLVLLCTHSPGIAVIVTNIALTLIYSVNYFVIMYRGTPLRVNDLSAIGTATKVVGDYSFVPNDHLAFAWGLLAMFVVYALWTLPGHKERERRKAKRLAQGEKKFWITKGVSYALTIVLAVTLGGYAGYQLTYTDLLNRVGFADEEFRGFYQDMIYYIDGYLVGTCIEVKNSRITPMEGYSVERVENILSEVSGNLGQVTEELPHVILIMNESFSDLRVLGGVELNQENMAFFNSLQENTVRGYVNASVIGGGTANTEFEVFTGCNTAFFSANYYPYQQAVKKPVNSLVSQMEKNGYTTYSIHPEPASNWNRGNVYRHYGFDESLWQKDFEGAAEIHSGVSDAETYKRVIELYENRKEGEKLFVFDLTMQNHGGYNMEKGEDEIVATNLQEPQVDEYLSLIKISDDALKDLVEYFESQDEKVVICMFGDHQPWVSKLIVKTDKTDSNLSMERLMSKYKTPFVIWANYDIEEADGYDISMNYLGGLLQRTAGIPLSPYFTYLEQLREQYPIITVNGYVDSEGNYYNWDGQGNEFPEYRMLQYNYLYDDETVDWGY